jgi:creatinine amidohydrolase
MNRPYILAEATWNQVRAEKYEVAVIPWGATEAHNYHLPYGTDTMQCDAVYGEAARLAWEEGAKVMLLPTVPFGIQTGQLDIPFCINLNPSTQMAMLNDIISGLRGQGI